MAYTGTHQIADSQNDIIDPATAEYQDMIKQILYLLRPLANVGSGTGRVQIDVANTLTAAISSLPILNINNIGGLGGFELQYNAGRSTYVSTVRSNITF